MIAEHHAIQRQKTLVDSREAVSTSDPEETPLPPNDERRGSRHSCPDDTNSTSVSVTPARCPATKLDGDACRGWAAADGWPYCSSHRWLNRHLVGTTNSWAAAYGGAEAWIREVGRSRWPDFAANDEIWASSIASWATHGQGL